jgi:hypothetical protein
LKDRTKTFELVFSLKFSDSPPPSVAVNLIISEDSRSRFSFFREKVRHIKHDDVDEVVLSDRGIYWLHMIEDFFSLDYIGKLWGISKSNPWPENVTLWLKGTTLKAVFS